MPAITVACPIALDAGWHIGEDKTLEFTVVDAAGTVVDITGWTLSWMLKRRMGDVDALAILTKTTGAGTVTITDGDAGECEVDIDDTDTDTAVVAHRDYWHELKRTDAGFEAILAQGLVNLNPSVHKT